MNLSNALRIESSNIYIHLGDVSLPNDKLLALIKRPGNYIKFYQILIIEHYFIQLIAKLQRQAYKFQRIIFSIFYCLFSNEFI